MPYFKSMSSVAEIRVAIENLPREGVLELLHWMQEKFEDDEWDQQMKADVEAGRLDHLIAQGKAALREGTGVKFP